MKKVELLKTEEAIGFTKDMFAKQLAEQLSLTKISSPIAVLDGTGINDDLNGVERAVSFPIKAMQEQKAVVVHSLAKWKRLRLQELEMDKGSGLLTDMRALRPDEDYSPLHSIYVDQWDWEMCIGAEQRSLAFLKATVEKIYYALQITEKLVVDMYDEIKPVLPRSITFVHAEELLMRYPTLSIKEREHKICKEYGAVFIIGIGGKLSNGEAHDGRAADYDDWTTKNEDGYFGLNGDILLWHPVLEMAFEVSSMGIRVDKTALLKQLEERACLERMELQFHKMLLADELPQSIGGGIGQSRVCMFMLRKKHIGEVQASIWTKAIREEMLKEGVVLL
jgi:aspartate--ammonia ligase